MYRFFLYSEMVVQFASTKTIYSHTGMQIDKVRSINNREYS